jgi:hypothetical protein
MSDATAITISGECERRAEAEHGCDDRRLERDREAVLDRRHIQLGIEALRKPARLEAVPDRDVADVGDIDVADVRALERGDTRRRRLVEREHDDDQDREIQEHVHEERPRGEAALGREEAAPTHRTAPRGSRT